jgi:hypothetical protein
MITMKTIMMMLMMIVDVSRTLTHADTQSEDVHAVRVHTRINANRRAVKII